MSNFKYCPRCGEVYGFVGGNNKYCNCIEELSFFERQKEKVNAILIETDIDEIDWKYDNRDQNSRRTAFGISLKTYEFFWENYIDIPENNKLNRKVFEAFKTNIYDFFNGPQPVPHPNYRMRDPNNPTKPLQPQPASVVGRAVVGAAIAGPAGAVVGAVSALDKNMRDKK